MVGTKSSGETLKSFEADVINCPSVVRCFLMSGSDDYIVIVMAQDSPAPRHAETAWVGVKLVLDGSFLGCQCGNRNASVRIEACPARAGSSLGSGLNER